MVVHSMNQLEPKNLQLQLAQLLRQLMVVVVAMFSPPF